jgi:hypothetical protein
VAGRGRLRGPGPGVPGRPAGIPQLVRLAIRRARAAESGSPGSAPSAAASRYGSRETGAACAGAVGFTSLREASCGCAGPVRCRRRPPASQSSATRTGVTTPRSWSSAPRSRCRQSTGSPGSTLACACSRRSSPVTAAPRRSPIRDTCVRPSVASPASSGSSAENGRARRTGPRPATGSRLLIAGSATGGPTTTTSSPCGCSARTKRSPWKISP